MAANRPDVIDTMLQGGTFVTECTNVFGWFQGLFFSVRVFAVLGERENDIHIQIYVVRLVLGSTFLVLCVRGSGRNNKREHSLTFACHRILCGQT